MVDIGLDVGILSNEGAVKIVQRGGGERVQTNVVAARIVKQRWT